MSTPQLLSGQTHAHHEVLLPSSSDHVPVPVREESRCNCDFFKWVDQEPRGKTKAWMEGRRIQEGYLRPQELFIPQQEHFESKKAEIREREEKGKRRMDEFKGNEKWNSRRTRKGTRVPAGKVEEWRSGHWYHGEATVGVGRLLWRELDLGQVKWRGKLWLANLSPKDPFCKQTFIHFQS